jgi:hypothetical protein
VKRSIAWAGGDGLGGEKKQIFLLFFLTDKNFGAYNVIGNKGTPWVITADGGLTSP